MIGNNGNNMEISNNKCGVVTTSCNKVTTIHGNPAVELVLQPANLLKIIKGYALEGATDNELVALLDHLLLLTPYIKEEKNKDIYNLLLKTIAGERNKSRNVTQDLRDYIFSTDGAFTLHECYNALGTPTPKEKAIVRKTLSSMCAKKELEKVGTKTGNYLKIDTSIEYTDIANTNGLGKPLKFETPLNMGDRTIFFPRSLWGIAGVTGNGKTTMAFNIIRNIQNLFEVVYFYEAELGPGALQHKLGYFHCPLSAWNFKAVCSANSQGVIQWDSQTIHQKIHPNAINIIDYLEPPEDAPWKIYHVMKKIAAALRNGMAIILIQKKEGAKFGVGGDWSAKATSFYTSLEWGCLKIEKNSYQQEDRIGRNFKCIDFEIAPGSHVKAKSGWYGENGKKKKHDEQFIPEEE